MALDWQPRQPSAELAERYRREGMWDDATFPPFTAAGLQAAADSRCRVRSAVRPFDGTIGDVAGAGRRLAGALARRGIGTGDVVAFQLPNWAETAACFYGLLLTGAVLVPIVHSYGHREVGHILRQSRARALVTAGQFRNRDHVADLAALLEAAPGLPDLELVVVVGDDRPLPRRGEPAWVAWDDVVTAAPLEHPAKVEPDDAAVVGYTSGTTAAPKGVVHTHRTLLAEIRQYGRFHAQDAGPPVLAQGGLSGAPMSHITGILLALAPLHSGAAINLTDVWEPSAVLEAMAEDRLSSGGGATFFLTSLLDHPAFDPDVHLPLMRRIGLGGAPVPAAVARRAADLGISLTRAYGSTEHPSTTMALHQDPEPKRLFTDGRAMPGVELRLVDADGREVPVGTPGEILSRGPDLFAGYTDPALNAAAFDTDGWFATGDIGVLDGDGFLTITDRKKDVIIRGGENVSAAEVEGVLQRMPGVSEVAVVAAPDPRYGEHGCAFVLLAPGAPAFDLAAVRAHLRDQGLAAQKWPEEIRFVDELPRTASGKVQKHRLRDALRAEAAPA